MRFNLYLQEEYVTHVKGTWGGLYDGESDVFENPSAKEMKDLTGDVRFIVNFATKKLYVWDWNITHTEIARHLKKERLVPSENIDTKFLKDCFAGLAEKQPE